MVDKDNYTWKVLDTIPANRQVLQFWVNPSFLKRTFIIEVFPDNSNSWIGIFHGEKPPGTNQVIKSPMPGVIFVYKWESGYFIDVYDPTKFEEFPSVGIEKIYNIQEKNLMLIKGIVDVSAYNQNGLLWITERFGHGDNVIREITENEVIGVSWIPWENQYVEFKVNLQTGELDIPDCARYDYLDKL